MRQTRRRFELFRGLRLLLFGATGRQSGLRFCAAILPRSCRQRPGKTEIEKERLGWRVRRGRCQEGDHSGIRTRGLEVSNWPHHKQQNRQKAYLKSRPQIRSREHHFRLRMASGAFPNCALFCGDRFHRFSRSNRNNPLPARAQKDSYETRPLPA